eukprot:CAMPEP_0168380832 /NCGR_PEP_ID=MMETSP0228-20121227/12564_1 /TAXON_ID=133427 /ORGANISM="Protoceratium reticulatum, Strain CCCM 535 (=CCMP 1889)" /LENGTH=67 /DNA_ID=CAMNT_0008393911 /DNA_START=47 /DNA_END=247 /DNA_ORIENTATION=+
MLPLPASPSRVGAAQIVTAAPLEFLGQWPESPFGAGYWAWAPPAALTRPHTPEAPRPPCSRSSGRPR